MGHLSFCQDDCLGSGNFGTVFIGKFKNVVDVAIKQFKKGHIRVETNILLKANGHPNIVNYYDTDTTDMKYM